MGELGTKARPGCTIDGRQFNIYETKAPQQSAHVYFYAEGLDSSDLTKELVAGWLCKKAGMSAEHIKVGDWRMTKSMGIEGGVVLVMADHDQARVLRLGSPVVGTTNVKKGDGAARLPRRVGWAPPNIWQRRLRWRRPWKLRARSQRCSTSSYSTRRG